MCFAAFANKIVNATCEPKTGFITHEDQRREIGQPALGNQAAQHDPVAVELNDIFVFSLNLDYRSLSSSVHSGGETWPPGNGWDFGVERKWNWPHLHNITARLMKRNVSIPKTFQLCDKKKSFSSRLLPSVFFFFSASENLGEQQKEKSEQQRNVRRDSKGRRKKIRE